MARGINEHVKKGGVEKKPVGRGRVMQDPIDAVDISDFVSATESITRCSATRLMNCFARYFVERTFDAIRILNNQSSPPVQASDDVIYVSHRLPIWDLHLFPLYNTGNPEAHEIIPLSKQKQSYLITRIAELVPQMATRLNKMSEDDGIPLPAISRILSAMVRRPHGMCFDSVDPSLEAENGSAMPSAPSYDSVLIPDSYPLNQRDNLLIEMSHKIHGLLAEAFIVVMLAGWYDLNVLRNLKHQGAELSILKDAVREMACCTWLESQLSTINVIDELEDCIHKEFSTFYNVAGSMLLYFNERISQLAPDYAYRLKADDCPHGQAAFEYYTEDINEEQETAIETLVRSKPYLTEGEKKKEVSPYRMMDFQTEILYAVKEKFSNKPWKKYELTGDLSNLRNFINTIVSNCCNKIIEEEVKIIPGLGRSFRTHRRYNREIRSGALNEFLKKINKLGTIKRVKDMSDEELELYKKYKKERALHHKEGKLTQNQLIEYLQDEKEIEKLNKKGILLKKNSVPTLKNKLKMLRKSGIIKYEQSGRTYHYKEEDKEQIAQALANL